MPPFSFEREHYRDEVREFFAFLPVKTIHGWALWVDCLEVATFRHETGWKTHFEKLPRWRP